MSSEDEMNNWEKPPAATKHRAQPRKPSSKRAHLDPDNNDDGAAKPGAKSKPRSNAAGVSQNGQESAPTTKPSVPSDAMEVDRAESQVNGQAATAATSIPPSSSEVKSRKELDRWKQKAKDLEAQRDALSKQLEDLFQIRKTEPEQTLEQLQVQYDERAKTQDALVKELTSQLARIEPLSRTGQAVALHFLTREAADEEKRAVEQDISRLQEVIKAKDSVIDEKTKRIAELEQSVQDATRERDAEIERSKELLARAAPKGTPNSRPHSKRPFGMDDPKMTEVIKFYEDMSNLLVAGVKFEHAPDSEEPDVIFHCVYTYYEMTRRADDIEGERIGEKSINFTMRIFNGFGGPNGEPASEDDFIHRRVKYAPLNLDREPDTFVKSLEYMGDTFTFPCAQQGLFLNSLREKIRDGAKDASESGSDIEGMDVGDRDSQS
ncbi:hypothetical protein JVT61DRAFT_2224 [Boletus reticuloceps]|uniref:Monopolin complex subunit Csm1/Pcs1 C-terminal domain-containing protein n=1 Tax=Boletus reticuloceps TaxID=495285 RepID=A0A8I3AAG0_9AGAM|nr:hypothetical protein JVT61DRAFT_2224 [Boletus reticuloceps]